jgi:hypothetical protein
MLDFTLPTRDPRRWLCTNCDAEGRGPEPEDCPYCHADAVWPSAEYGDDRRPMAEIARELIEDVADIMKWSYLQ